MWIYVWSYAAHSMQVEVSNSWESFLAFHCATPNDGPQVFRIGIDLIYPWIILIVPKSCNLENKIILHFLDASSVLSEEIHIIY